jgi:hypothetical protein
MPLSWYDVFVPDDIRSLDVIDASNTPVLDLVGPNDGCRSADQWIRFQHDAGLQEIVCRYTTFERPTVSKKRSFDVKPITCADGLTPSDSFSTDCASLTRLHYKTLQRLCCNRGGRPGIIILRLDESDWYSAYATGVGCKRRMICSLMSSHSRNTTACYARLAEQQKLKSPGNGRSAEQAIVARAVVGADHAALTAFCMFPDRHYGSLFCNSVDEWEACYCPSDDAKMGTMILAMTQRNPYDLSPSPSIAHTTTDTGARRATPDDVVLDETQAGGEPCSTREKATQTETCEILRDEVSPRLCPASQQVPVTVAEAESFLVGLCSVSLVELQRECLNPSAEALRIMRRHEWAKCWAPLRRMMLELIAFQFKHIVNIKIDQSSSLAKLMRFISESSARVVLHLAGLERSGVDATSVGQLDLVLDKKMFFGSTRDTHVFLNR